MTGEASFTEEEVTELRKLLEIEKIRKKKVLYSHRIDSVELKEYSNIYTEDAVCDWGPFGSVKGSAEIYELNVKLIGHRVPYFSFHATTNMWIELTSPTTASSRCYLFDINNDTNPRINPIKYFGVYEERWVKIGEDWKINRQWAQFIWPERTADAEFPHPMPEPTLIG